MTSPGEREEAGQARVSVTATGRIGFRVLVYALAAAAVFEAAVLAAGYGHAYPLGREYGPIEVGHLLLALAAGALLLGAARRDATATSVLRLCAIAAWLAAARESDRLLGDLFYEGVHKLLAVPLGVAGIYVVTRSRDVLAHEAAAFVRTPAFYFFVFALLTVGVYSQLIGQETLWEAVMGDGYQRAVKNTVEELQELLGYLFLLFGAIEAWVFSRAADAARTR